MTTLPSRIKTSKLPGKNNLVIDSELFQIYSTHYLLTFYCRYVFAFLGNLLLAGVFKTIQVSFLPVVEKKRKKERKKEIQRAIHPSFVVPLPQGHTHEEVDAMIGAFYTSFKLVDGGGGVGGWGWGSRY